VSEIVYLLCEKNALLVQSGNLAVLLFAQTLKSFLEITYEVAYRISKQNNPHPTTDIFVKVFALVSHQTCYGL
jgi:hypothetical protein